jgi:hypothetical protein
VPHDDGGRFNLRIDSTTAQSQPCGGKLGPIVISPGNHRVSESAATGTRLSDYTSTIGGDCDADGSITLAAGAAATCTITNARPTAPTGTVEIENVCRPANANGQLQGALDAQEFPGMSCGDSTGPIETSTGTHLISLPAATVATPAAPEAAPTPEFKTVFRRACARNGTLTLRPGQRAVCTLVHIRRHVKRGRKPPPACYHFVVTRHTLVVGVRVTVVGRITLLGRPVQNAKIHLSGLGASRTVMTAANGEVRFVLTFRRVGLLKLTTRRQFGCRPPPVQHVAVAAATSPRFTG